MTGSQSAHFVTGNCKTRGGRVKERTDRGSLHLLPSPSASPLGSDAALASRPWLQCSPLLKSWHLLLLACFCILTLPELWYWISGTDLPILSQMSHLDLIQFSMSLLSHFNGHLFNFVTHYHPDYCSIFKKALPCSMSKYHVSFQYFTISAINDTGVG